MLKEMFLFIYFQICLFINLSICQSASVDSDIHISSRIESEKVSDVNMLEYLKERADYTSSFLALVLPINKKKK